MSGSELSQPVLDAMREWAAIDVIGTGPDAHANEEACPCGEWQEQRGIIEAAGLFGCPRCGGDWPDGPKGLPPATPAEEGTR